VVCVSASPDVAPERALDAAQEIVATMFDPGEKSKCSPFDLAAGEGHSWTVTERERPAWQPGQRFGWITDAYLPGWTQQSTTDLLTSTTFAADAATNTLRTTTAATGPAVAIQSALAAFDRYGFEAAAATMTGRATSGHREPTETGVERRN
jgi:hypothetical protein